MKKQTTWSGSHNCDICGKVCENTLMMPEQDSAHGEQCAKNVSKNMEQELEQVVGRSISSIPILVLLKKWQDNKNHRGEK